MKVSIILIATKAPKQFDNCVHSILNQTHTQLELLIINNTDNKSIKITDNRVKKIGSNNQTL